MKAILISLFLFSYGCLNAQEFKDPLNIITPKDYQKYEQRKNKLLKKEKWFKYDSSYISIVCFHLNFQNKDIEMFSQKEFLDKSFIQELYPYYHCLKKRCKEKDNIISFLSAIYDSMENPLVYIDPFTISNRLIYVQELNAEFKDFKKYDLLYKFHIGGTNGFIEFGVTKNGDILVLNKRNSIREDYPLEKGVYPFEYFIENYWGKLFPSEPPRPQ